MNEKANEQMVGARLRLIRDAVFFGSVAMQLSLRETMEVPVMATDGIEVIYNPDAVLEMKFKEVIGVWAHEVMHVVCLHHLRRGSRDPRKWNYACDYVVNLIVKENGFCLPDGCLYDKQYEGMSVEEVYNIIPDPPPQPQGGGSGPEMMGGVSDATSENGKPLSESEKLAAEAAVKGIIQNAAALAKKQGQMTASLEKIVEATCVPKADWRSVLRDFVLQHAFNDFNWAKPDKRQMAQYGIVTPTLDGLELGELCVINDASGSCSDEQEQAASEISCILADYECTIHCLHHDTELKSVETYTSDDLPIQLHPSGFGGTDAASTYAYVAENFNPVCLIHLTDGEMNWEHIPVPNCPVLIACSTRSAIKDLPAWAEVVDISQ